MVMEGVGFLFHWFWKSHPKSVSTTCFWNKARCRLEFQRGCGKEKGYFFFFSSCIYWHAVLLVIHLLQVSVFLQADDARSCLPAQQRALAVRKRGAGEHGSEGRMLNCSFALRTFTPVASLCFLIVIVFTWEFKIEIQVEFDGFKWFLSWGDFIFPSFSALNWGDGSCLTKIMYGRRLFGCVFCWGFLLNFLYLGIHWWAVAVTCCPINSVDNTGVHNWTLY